MPSIIRQGDVKIAFERQIEILAFSFLVFEPVGFCLELMLQTRSVGWGKIWGRGKKGLGEGFGKGSSQSKDQSRGEQEYPGGVGWGGLYLPNHFFCPNSMSTKGRSGCR